MVVYNRFLAFKDLYIQTDLRNKFLKEALQNLEFWPTHINITQYPYNIHHINAYLRNYVYTV